MPVLCAGNTFKVGILSRNYTIFSHIYEILVANFLLIQWMQYASVAQWWRKWKRCCAGDDSQVCFPAGRGLKSHAYTHSVQFTHHVFLNLHTLKFYCLPDNYEIIDSSLEDITVSPSDQSQNCASLMFHLNCVSLVCHLSAGGGTSWKPNNLLKTNVCLYSNITS